MKCQYTFLQGKHRYGVKEKIALMSKLPLMPEHPGNQENKDADELVKPETKKGIQ